MKTKWKKIIHKTSVKTGSAGSTGLSDLMPKCCLFQWIFSLSGRLCSEGKRFDWANVIFFCRLFHTEKSWHAYWFTAVIVSGRHDLASDARAFPLTSFEMQPSLLRLNKGLKLFNFLQSNSWVRIIISDFPSVRECNGFSFPTMFCHTITTAYLAFAFLIARFRFLVTFSSKGTTNEYTYKSQYNSDSQHVHEL